MRTHATSSRQRLVGSCLREYRESAGFELDDAARILDCDRSKVSRFETGQRSIRAKELRELLAEYGAEPAVEEALVALARSRRDGVGWWTEYASVLRDPYLEFVAAADASVPEEWESAAAGAVLARQRVILHEPRHAWRWSSARPCCASRSGTPP